METVVALALPPFWRERCFAEADIDRLRTRGRVRYVEGRETTLSLEQAYELVEEAEVLITGWGTPFPFDDRLFRAAPGLRLMYHAAGTVKAGLPPSFWRRGVRLGTCRDALGRGVAEFALGMLIVTLKRSWTHVENTRRGLWDERAAPTRELYGLRIGVVAASAVGRHLLRLLRGFEVERAVYDPYLSDAEAPALGAVRVGTLDELFATSEAVVLCAPNLPELRRMVGARQFALMPPGGVFVNVARGALVDDAALKAACRSGRIAAVVDVTDPEPPPPGSDWFDTPNLYLTPHIAGHAANGQRRQGRQTTDEVLRFLDGGPLRHEVKESMVASMA